MCYFMLRKSTGDSGVGCVQFAATKATDFYSVTATGLSLDG